MTEIKATLRNLNIAPRKVRLVASSVKGLHVQSAIARLDSMPQRSAGHLAKLLLSAVANAKDLKLDENKLVVKSIEVNKGITLKRIRARAKGRATPVEKKMSHVTLLLEESDSVKRPEFVIQEKKKEEKKEPKRERKEQPRAKQQDTANKEKTRKGFKERVFRRKSV
ncbi:MAG: 50S ribosomal protein L22 [Candidatus Colwellbacteria bacterium RIFCSPHIGHO2_02_FULL_45_17]|uniref:Large ribosomal subunit protein uL22 n=3 Tax=Parcubacteria group TaxID=1794811 RepID=A0A0H4TEZ2_9BACT|nr:50S ribosomal protein S50 RplV [uncultured Parcubacteria bacterium Rifle_16ft_4_minimus_37647]AKQ05585.1 50S ribosomal protein S50 RplV [uncultured Parcubacteria bacterium Rifle_16ft_4_minimus_23790]OGY58601.1 MAG: 50S ribosomal protein L22 [Candidatus Colwellbacteria bacterium RIFCSPHIGHO2_02_FULL_45_17]OGY61696.1 MAG: 50S ribosomal protein L22 [Candidatus Colwellbacteria bacterium RIFCSPLOWO2_02_FULL_45_11]